MSDAVNAHQRNLYQKKFFNMSYTDGRVRERRHNSRARCYGFCAACACLPLPCASTHLSGRMGSQGATYDKQLRRLSWPVPSDVPTHAQESSQKNIEAGAYDTLHPMNYATHMETYESSFKNSYASFGMHIDAIPSLSVYDRLFTPTRSLGKTSYKHPVTRTEISADEAFASGQYEKAIRLFTQAIAQKSSLFAYEKRCAALAHVGRYQDALADAYYILRHGMQVRARPPSCPALAHPACRSRRGGEGGAARRMADCC